MPIPADLLSRAKQLLATPSLAELGPEKRSGTHSEAELDEAFGKLWHGRQLPPERRRLVEGALYLWHDHLDRSHRIAQEIHTAEGSMLHGMMHRREPDFGNAAYWFRKVGTCQIFQALAARVRPLTASHASAESLAFQALVKRESWDPFAFIQLCEKAPGLHSSEREFLKRLQLEEFDCFIEENLKPMAI